MSDPFTATDYVVSSGRCQECRGTGYHRYRDFPDGRPNFSDSAPCAECDGSGRVQKREDTEVVE